MPVLSKPKKKVLIVGGGVAGASTAIFLSEIEGIEVTLLEAQNTLGGIFRTRYSSTMFYYPERGEMAELEKRLGKEKVDAFHKDLVGAVSVLETQGVIRNKYKSGFKNYEAEGVIRNTYALDLGGRFVNALTNLAYKIAAPAAVAQLYGPELHALKNVVHIAQRLVHGAKRSKAKIVLNARVQSVNSKHVTTKDGREFQYDTLVLASGGVGSNVELLNKLYGVNLLPHVFNKINDGLSLQVALTKKWKYNKELLAWFTEAVELKNGEVAAALFLLGPALIVVDSTGKRVYDEKLVYNIRGKTTMKYGELILVSDVDNMKKFATESRMLPPQYGSAIPPLSSTKHVKATSAAALCKVLKEGEYFKTTDDFGKNFVEQLKKYQDYARTGKDPEFNRGGRGGEHLDSKKYTVPPNHAMFPLDETKLVAIKLNASSLDTCSGPVVSGENRVVQENGAVVDNVFAVGNCCASILDGHYVAPGLPVSCAIVGAFTTARAIKKTVN